MISLMSYYSLFRRNRAHLTPFTSYTISYVVSPYRINVNKKCFTNSFMYYSVLDSAPKVLIFLLDQSDN